MNLRDIFESDLMERVHDIVYHATYLPYAYQIVKTGQFKLSSAAARDYGNFEHPKGYPFYLSTARSRAGSYVGGGTKSFGSGRVMLKLDGSWFNRHYRSAPVDYYQRTARGYSEQEDRVFSKNPTMPAPNIMEIHVLMFEDSKTDGVWLRRLMIECKKKNIPIWVYSDGNQWILQNKKHALNWQQIQSRIVGGETIPWQGSRSGRKNYFATWMELWHKNHTTQLSKPAETLRYDLIYTNWINEVIQQFKNDLNNERKPSSTGYHHAVRVVKLMQKHGLNPREFVLSLREKWRNINLAQKYNVTPEQVKAKIDQGTAEEIKKKADPALARDIAFNNIGWDLEFYDKPQSDQWIDENHSMVAESKSSDTVLKDFLRFAVKKLQLTQLPKISFRKQPSPTNPSTFGYFDPETDKIVIVLNQRHPMDIMRTLAHELVHFKQRLSDQLHDRSGETGSTQENQANAVAGSLMRDFGKLHEKYFAENHDQLDEIFMFKTDQQSDRTNPSPFEEKYHHLVKNHTVDTFTVGKHTDILIHQVQTDTDQSKDLFRFIGMQNDQIVVVVVAQKIPVLGQSVLEVKSAWVSSQVSGKNLAANMYVLLSKKFGRTIVSDDMQTQGGAMIWTRGLPKLGFYPVPLDMSKGVVMGVDPYHTDDDVRWAFDARRKLTSKTFGTKRIRTMKPTDNDED